MRVETPTNSILLEQKYQKHIENEKMRLMRVMCVLGALLYIVFTFADLHALPSAIEEAITIRVFVILVMGIVYLTTYNKEFFIKYYSYILPIPYLVASVGIEAMIYYAEPTDSAYNSYFAGLILVIMILYSWSHLGIKLLTVTTAFIIGIYITIALNKPSTSTGITNIETIVPNILFLISAGVIGLVTHLIRNEYLRKNFLLKESLEEIIEEKTKEAKTNEYIANHDALTDLPNRRYANEQLEQALIRAMKKGKYLVIMFVDLNRFKSINDLYGHAAGDFVLKVVARRLETATRCTDVLARFGGDEFLVAVTIDKERIGDIKTLTDKFEEIISQKIKYIDTTLSIGASVGYAAYPIHGNKINNLLEIADKKMYDIKRGRGNNRDIKPEDTESELIIFPGHKGKKLIDY